jgi:hypothetical protein
MTENWYDTAQICINGHVINPASVSNPIHNKRFCDSCGKSTITTCQICTSPIRGVFHGTGPVRTSSYTVPKFCHNCGNSFPWAR